MASAAVLVFWLMWPAWFQLDRPSLRIDMLAVGDGSCYLLRSGGSTVIFDAGSSTDLNVGKRSLIPGLRRLGVRSIDVIAVSHADLDHYSAVLEIADEFGVEQALVTPQFMAEARSDLFGPAAHVIEGLTRRRISVVETAVGEERAFGSSQWTWLNPIADMPYHKPNNGSMVVRIECAGQSLLLCGDIQAETMRALAHNASFIRADVLELPHHGSHNDEAERFVDLVQPKVVMQSTGWSRWKRDKWAAKLSDVERLVTARDGACWVEIDDQGRISTGRFLQIGATAGSD